MTTPTEVAVLLKDLRDLIDFAAQENVHHPDYDLAAAFEAALTKAEAVAYCDSEDPAKLANVALSHGGHGCTVPLVYAHARPPAEPVESLGRDAEPAGGLDAAMRTNGLPAVSDALGYSRNFAAANPHLTQTAKDHITGLCDMLELASAHQTTPPAPPPASVPDGWMPISSAPKDGAFVHVYEPGWDHEQMDQEIARYSSSSKKWVWAHAGMSMNPTHWKPLSAPPTTQEGAAP